MHHDRFTQKNELRNFPREVFNQFAASYLISKTSQCDNCTLILSVRLQRFIVERFAFENWDKYAKESEFATMMSVYMTAQLLIYCFSSFHTTRYWTSSRASVREALITFFYLGMMHLKGFHERSTENDRCDAILFRVSAEAYTEALRLFFGASRHITRSPLWDQTFRNVLPSRQEMTHGSMSPAARVCKYFGDIARHIYIGRKGTFKNNKWFYKHVALPFAKIAALFDQLVLVRSDSMMAVVGFDDG